MSKWIEFVERTPRPKTKTWAVITKEGGYSIGMIKWYAPWRKYSFFPESNTIFETQCLSDIAMFLNAEMEKRKVEKSNG